MADDRPVPLCTWAQFTAGAFNDLARGCDQPSDQNGILSEATRLIEQAVDRRLAPFTGLVETVRATGVDPDEYPAAGIPVSQSAALGQSYANALGNGDNGVRHAWLNEFAARNPELWTYSNVTVSVTTTYGGNMPATIIGPEPDSGHVWFSLGTWVPPGSLVRVVYGGGYTVAIPADLVRAGKLMVASLIMREIQPAKANRDPSALWDDAVRAAAGYVRD